MLSYNKLNIKQISWITSTDSEFLFYTLYENVQLVKVSHFYIEM